MKSATLVTALTGLTKAMAVAAPVVVFGFLYVLLVQPQRAASFEARTQLNAAREELGRQRVPGRSPVAATATLDELETRTAEGDRVVELVAAITASLNGPAVGGVSNLLVATGEPGDGLVDSTVVPASQKVRHTPVTLTFDARYEQIGRFFTSLRALPTTFDLRDVDLTSHPVSPAGLMKAKVSLLVFHRPGATVRGGPPQPQTVDAVAPPQPPRDPVTKRPAATAAGRRANGLPVQPDPVVTGILVSGGRRVALVDGRIVRTGDRLPAGVVQSIDPDAVVIAGPDGQIRRLKLEKRVIEMQTR